MLDLHRLHQVVVQEDHHLHQVRRVQNQATLLLVQHTNHLRLQAHTRGQAQHQHNQRLPQAHPHLIPHQRWSVYKKLPSFLRNHSTTIEDFLFINEKTSVEICEFRDYNRHEVINVYEFFEDWDCDIQDYNEKHPDEPIDVNLSKEKILKMNLGSIENDW